MSDETKSEPVMEEVVKISVLTPIIYVSLLVGVFLTFSVLYRKKRVKQLSSFEPIFGENYASDIYANLKLQYIDESVPKADRPHEKVMKAALLRRACEAIRRSMKLKENGPAYNKLYQDGLIGDDMLKQYEIQVKFQEIELKDIVAECESYKKGWVQTFFPTAQEICFNEALRRRLFSMEDRTSNLMELWEIEAEKSEKVLDAIQKNTKGDDKSSDDKSKSNEEKSEVGGEKVEGSGGSKSKKKKKSGTKK
jgi:translocation protein SEC66